MLACSSGTASNAQNRPIKFAANTELRAELIDISLLYAAVSNADTTNSEILAAAQSDYARFLSNLYEQGYYGGNISIQINGKEAADYSPFEQLTKINSVSVTINEGKLFKFGNLSISPRPTGHVTIPEFNKGLPAQSQVIQEAVDDVIDAWRNDGRPTVRVDDQTIIADHTTATLDAAFKIDPGPVARFGQLKIVGHERMRLNRVLKIAGLETGEIYDPEKIRLAANRLRETGIFSTVAVTEAKEVDADGTFDITATVVEAKLRRIGAGASISTTEGVSLEGFWIHRNLMGGGERLRFDAAVTGLGGETDGRDLSLGVRLTRPATLSPDTHASFILAYTSEKEPDYTLTNYTLGLEFEHRFSEQLKGTTGIRYRDSDTNDSFGIRNFRLIEFPTSLTFDGRDSKVQPTKGYFASISADPFYDMDRNVSGARMFVDGRAYKNIGADFVLAARVQLGSVVGPELAEIAPDHLFYSGGGGTVRGQAYQSLGVDLGGDTKSGGKSFVGFSTEFRFPIRAAVGGVVFADYGYIGRGSDLLSAGEAHAGVGIWVRVETGLGPLRVDIAKPDNKSFDLSNLNFYIGIGHAF